MTEFWQRSSEFPRYQVSSLGRVFDGKNKRVLKSTPDLAGYHRVKIHTPDGDRKTYSLHRLVMRTFYEYLPDAARDREVNHIDFDKSNNTLANLEYTTREENMLHAFAGGVSRPVHPIRKVQIVETGEVFESTGAVDRYLSVSYGSTSKTLRGLQPTCRGYTFEYV